MLELAERVAAEAITPQGDERRHRPRLLRMATHGRRPWSIATRSFAGCCSRFLKTEVVAWQSAPAVRRAHRVLREHQIELLVADNGFHSKMSFE